MDEADFPEAESGFPRHSFPWNWAVVPLVFLLGLGAGWLLWGRTPVDLSSEQVTIPQNVKRYNVPIAGSPSLGPADAPITLVEFGDYQCPFCREWYQNVYARLMKDYQGKIHFVFRDMPLTNIHPDAFSAAEAADCAGDQGAYWPYHDALFAQADGLGDAAYIKYAQSLGLDLQAFTTCIQDNRYQKQVQSNFDYALSIGVNSTPTFFINGLALVGAQPYEIFKQVIDQELAGKIPK